MCFHCHQTIQAGLSFKDFLPLVGTAIVALLGYYGITIQIRKNRRSKWIEDFRAEIANCTRLVGFLDMNGPDRQISDEEAKELLNSLMLLRLYLNMDDPFHSNFYKMMKKFINDGAKDGIVLNILDTAKQIIDKEQNKLKRLW